MVFLLAAVNDLADERSNGVVEVLDGKLNEEGAAIRDGLVNANGQSARGDVLQLRGDGFYGGVIGVGADFQGDGAI